MNRALLLKKLEGMLAAAEREKMWGNLEIEIRGGVPTVLRQLTTERLAEQPKGENPWQKYRPTNQQA